MKIALIGDYAPEITAHRGDPPALGLAAREPGTALQPERVALAQKNHSLIAAFVKAAL